jgi:predicted deacylase
MTSLASAYPGIHFNSVTFTALEAGPRVIITGAVHGNEICGTAAIRRVIEEINGGLLTLKAGLVTFVPTTNPLAYAKGQRSGERNLNRNLYPNPEPKDFEDLVANWLCPLLAQHEVLLDLHSFHAMNEPFVMVGPADNDGPLQPFKHAAKEKALARQLGVQRFVDGWLATYARGVARRQQEAAQRKNNGESSSKSELLNTDVRYGVGTTEFMRSTGGYALTLECGQHKDPQAPHVAYRAIINALSFLGVLEQPKHAQPADQNAPIESLSIHEVIDKVHVEDSFSRTWGSFDQIKQGELIGTRHDGTPVVAAADSIIMFPDKGAQAGAEWFYLAQRNA